MTHLLPHNTHAHCLFRALFKNLIIPCMNPFSQICIGTIYLRLGNTWLDSYSRTALLFFIVAFLTFMSISGFPAFVEDMAVFYRERQNGYYGERVGEIAGIVDQSVVLS